MKNVFDEFYHLWPLSSHKSLKPLLSAVQILEFPKDALLMAKVKKPAQTVVVTETVSTQEIIQILSLGFEHILHRDRTDFAKEILASALMINRPDSFLKNPIPFFFTGFQDPKDSSYVETNINVGIRKTADKSYVLNKLNLFLQQGEHLSAIKELCIQAADEQISNALFSAPVKTNGEHPYQNLSRTAEIVLPENRRAQLFVGFSDERVIVGCEDTFGSIQKHLLLEHLEKVFQKLQAKPNSSAGGAGLGLKFMIENSANFYIYVEPGKKTIVACAFRLTGMRGNLDSKKHFHLSFR